MFESRACSVSAYIIFRIFDKDVSSPKSLLSFSPIQMSYRPSTITGNLTVISRLRNRCFLVELVIPN